VLNGDTNKLGDQTGSQALAPEKFAVLLKQQRTPLH
jgi:hypothetical protein